MLTNSTPAASIERLADRLSSARQRRFTGREHELSLFRSALASDEPPWAVLFVHGPGGVGKTTLLDTFVRAARGMGVASTIIDGHLVDPSPTGFHIALQSALGLPSSEDPAQAFPTDRDSVLILDTYEQMAPLDRWLRDEFLPSLPARVRIVIAGRNSPGPAWRTDNGWGDIVQIVSLRNLRPDESRAYLKVREVPENLHDDILAFTHGHPLALSLVADTAALGDTPGDIRSGKDPDVVRALLERFIQSVPDASHRTALELCAQARVTSETLLANVLGEQAGKRTFDWLRDMSFIERGPQGLFPHDLARDVLEADLRWRNPERYKALHQHIRNNAVQRIQSLHGLEQQLAFFDLLFLHRHSPIMQPYFEWSSLGGAYAETATAGDHPDIIAMIERFEGAESAALARHWLRRQPEAFTVYRDTASQVIGFVTGLDLQQATDEDRALDPAIRVAHDFVQRYGPARPGEVVLHHRWTMDREEYQSPSVSWDMDVMHTTVQWLTTPRLAWTFVLLADPDVIAPMMHYVNFQRSPEADFVVGGRSYGAFTHDWRSEPPIAWLDLMAERELALNLTPEQVRTAHPPPLVVLSQPEFEDAVRRALRDFTRPDALASSPLLRSRLVQEHDGAASPVDALREIMQTAIDSLRGNPRDERLYRALHRTYVSPAVTQELAAEALDLPFSTYRYHLTTGIERVTTWLWQRELHGHP
jgi:hypothetical protein